MQGNLSRRREVFLPTANVDLVRRAFLAFNTGNLDTIEQLIDPDYLNHEALDDDDERSRLRGPEEFRATVHWLRNAFSDLHFEIEEIIAADDKVVARTRMSGRHTGEFMGFQPSGRTFSTEQMHIFRIAHNRLAEHRAVRDDLGMMLQLGLLVRAPATIQ